MKGNKIVLAHCLIRLVNANLTDHDYGPEGQEFGQTMFDNLPPFVNTEDTTEGNSEDSEDYDTEDTIDNIV